MADFEEGGISWEDFLELISNMIVPSFEGVIAEIVDNSIDSGSKEIVIELFGKDWEEFAVLIYDNGSGFESTEKLKTAFDPRELKVRDVSHQHAGHAGWREGGETHFEVDMKADVFAGTSRVAAHRMVNKVLADELASNVHALQLNLSA